MEWPWLQTFALSSCHTIDPEIDRVNRSSRLFDVGVKLSRKSRRKLSWSIESVVRLWSRVSRFSAVKSTFLTGWPSLQWRSHSPRVGTWHVPTLPPRAHPTSARVGRKICTNSKSFLRSRVGVADSVYFIWTHHENAFVHCILCMHIWLLGALPPDHHWGSAPGPRWGTSVPRSPVPTLPSNPGYANASLWRKMTIRHQIYIFEIQINHIIVHLQCCMCFFQWQILWLLRVGYSVTRHSLVT